MLNQPEIFKTQDYVAFTFTPDKGEILSGVNSVYVDGVGRLHIVVGYEINADKVKVIQERNSKMREAVIAALKAGTSDSSARRERDRLPGR